MAQETLERPKTAGKETTRKTEEAFSASADNLREISVNLIDMAHANIESAFEFAREAATVRSPSDMVSLWTTHARKQFELLGVQSRKLAELGQHFVAKSAPSITPED
jgi:hypothetical protein